jgi:hypothetical protein
LLRYTRPKGLPHSSGVDQDTRVEDGGGVELRLGSTQRGGKGRGPLAIVRGAMVAADGVVVGDRATAVDQRLGDGGLDLVPLLSG